MLALLLLAAAAPARAADLERLAPVLVHDSRERDHATSVPRPDAARPPVVYGREAGGWRQYWIWFDFNPQDRGILRSGRHAGDWEVVQYRGEEAVYAQHSGAERCGSYERRGGRPVVYVANGSHAAYFHAGTRDRMWPDPNDEADGRGEVQSPRVVRISETEPAWMRDREPWGGARAGWAPFENSSPRGPAFQPARWDPAAFARAAHPCTGRRCTRVGACDGDEKALTAGLVAVPLAAALLLWRRRRRR